jgi:hypothetical protein
VSGAQTHARGLIAALIAIGSLAAAPFAWGSTDLPFTSTFGERICGQAAALVGTDQCEVTTTASAASGRLAATTRLISPSGGRSPWAANSMGSSSVTAVYHVPAPVPRLDFTARIHIDRASVTLTNLGWASDDLVKGRLGQMYWELAQGAIAPSHSVAISVSASACVGATPTPTAAQCEQGGGAADVGGLTQRVPGTASLSDDDYVVQFAMNPVPGKLIPAGDVTVKASVHVHAWQGSSMGNDSATVEGVVRSISVE